VGKQKIGRPSCAVSKGRGERGKMIKNMKVRPDGSVCYHLLRIFLYSQEKRLEKGGKSGVAGCQLHKLLRLNINF